MTGPAPELHAPGWSSLRRFSASLVVVNKGGWAAQCTVLMSVAGRGQLSPSSPRFLACSPAPAQVGDPQVDPGDDLGGRGAGRGWLDCSGCPGQGFVPRKAELWVDEAPGDVRRGLRVENGRFSPPWWPAQGSRPHCLWFSSACVWGPECR